MTWFLENFHVLEKRFILVAEAFGLHHFPIEIKIYQSISRPPISKKNLTSSEQQATPFASHDILSHYRSANN